MSPEIEDYLKDVGILNVLGPDRTCLVLYTLLKDPIKARQKLAGFININYLKDQLGNSNEQRQCNRHLGAEVLAGHERPRGVNVRQPLQGVPARADHSEGQLLLPRGVTHHAGSSQSQKILP